MKGPQFGTLVSLCAALKKDTKKESPCVVCFCLKMLDRVNLLNQLLGIVLALLTLGVSLSNTLQFVCLFEPVFVHSSV